ncbi:MAG: helix-turn-helix protein [Clostridia bacterium]|nr:helix-turn-helix protein [Clostridia bacterium]
MLDFYKIGNQITLLRKEKGLTGEKFSEMLGVSPQAVSKWENGKNLPETALLPLISEILGTSIDSLLIPKELLILNAIYSDGVKNINVTQTVNYHINCNKLNIIVNPQFLGASLETGRVDILAVKYQTPEGTFYDFAVQDENLTIDLTTNKYKADKTFEIIGAYYGNKKVYKSAMQKMKHYEYFKWNEIYVNHETFPSSPSTDEPEFLTIVYLNSKGLQVVSCQENEILCYSVDKTEIYLKDTSACILPGIMTLEWEKGMDCTWAGAVYAALKYMGESYTYEQIMGMSGACYRIAFTEVWDWSATDALVAFDYSSILFNAIGYEQIFADRVEKDDRHSERQRIISDIVKRKPVIAINLRIAPEWGVITGYSDNGNVFYCRTYFDDEYLNKNKDYLETDFWPFLITHFGDKKEKPTDTQILKISLQVLIDSFEATCSRGYYQGQQAYEKWIEGIKNDSLWDERSTKDDIERRIGVNDSTLLNLIDARRCAAEYLKHITGLLSDEKAKLLSDIAAEYQEITNMLTGFRKKLKVSDGDDLRYNVIDTKNKFNVSLRSEQIELLEKICETEKEIVKKVKIILK